jgi:heme/copper-type cytochrome/quinol oxidase subunit 2
MFAISSGEFSLLLVVLVVGVWWFFRRIRNAHESRAEIERLREYERLTTGPPVDIESPRRNGGRG